MGRGDTGAPSFFFFFPHVATHVIRPPRPPRSMKHRGAHALLYMTGVPANTRPQKPTSADAAYGNVNLQGRAAETSTLT